MEKNCKFSFLIPSPLNRDYVPLIRAFTGVMCEKSRRDGEN